MIIMNNKKTFLSCICRCILVIPAILMILHHCGVFTMSDALVRITGILIIFSLFGVGYFSMRMKNEK